MAIAATIDGYLVPPDLPEALALAHAERADTLQRANATLEQLGAIGREITENLDASGVFAALQRHVEGLLDVTAFLLYRLAGDGQSLTVAFGVEDGEPIPSYSLRLDHPQSWVARCARRREEIVLDLPEANANAPEGAVPGTLGTRSLMFAPLLVGTRLLGVLTIQSTQVRAYAERERAILRTLCAYGAIALTNAEALGALHQAQTQLVLKNAELGRWGGEEFLVICPDTELNGVAVMAETLRAKVAGFSFPMVGQRTASFGVAAYTTGDSLTAIMARVDQGLYAAKGSGRNQVVAGR